MIAIDISKHKALDADLKAIQQINFDANLDRDRSTLMVFIIEEATAVRLSYCLFHNFILL